MRPASAPAGCAWYWHAFFVDKFLADVKTAYERRGRCVMAVSEGIHHEAGVPIWAAMACELEPDAHGNVPLNGSAALADFPCGLMRDRLKRKPMRGDTFGYLQRRFVGYASDVDQREVGRKAVQYAMWGQASGSVAINRTGFHPADLTLPTLAAVAGKTRTMDDAFIAGSGTDLSDALRRDLRPRLGWGMVDAIRLRPMRCPKS